MKKQGCDDSVDTVGVRHAQQDKLVRIVYGRWYSPPLHYLLTNNKWCSVLFGMMANSRLSARYIPRFVKKYSIDLSEIEGSIPDFKTFNEFFVRMLKTGARPLPPLPNAVASPADGTVMVMQTIGAHTQFPIKGVTLSVETLLQNRGLAQQFEGGTAFVVRLAPWDYHRFHFSVTGIPGPHHVIHGRYESVHPLVYRCGIQPLEVNERRLILHTTEHGSEMAIIPVGALFVGSITQTYTPHATCMRGDEMGYFSCGGSTIVLLFQANKVTAAEEIIVNSIAGKETPIKMGQSIGYM